MYQRLLVPVDGGELSERAMAESIALARQLGAGIAGFVAEPFAASPPGIGFAYGGAVARHDGAVLAHAGGVTKRFAELCEQAGVPFIGHVAQTADIEAAIVSAAEQLHCDMIVMTTHGRSRFGELLWGSHTKNLINRCKLPVLVLH